MRRQAGQPRVDLRPLPQPFQDAIRQRGIEQGLARAGATDRLDEIEAAHLLQDVAGRSRHDRGDQRLVVGVRRQHHAGDARGRRSDFPADLDAAAIGQPDIENGDPRLVGGVRSGASATVAGSPTTSMSSAASSSARSPVRTTSWSSRRNTPSAMADIFAWGADPAYSRDRGTTRPRYARPAWHPMTRPPPPGSSQASTDPSRLSTPWRGRPAKPISLPACSRS